MRKGRRVTRKERVRVLAVRVTTREKEKGQWCALTVGNVAMTLRDAGRSILNSFLGKSTNVVEENYYHQCDHADNNGMSVCAALITIWSMGDVDAEMLQQEERVPDTRSES